MPIHAESGSASNVCTYLVFPEPAWPTITALMSCRIDTCSSYRLRKKFLIASLPFATIAWGGWLKGFGSRVASSRDSEDRNSESASGRFIFRIPVSYVKAPTRTARQCVILTRCFRTSICFNTSGCRVPTPEDLACYSSFTPRVLELDTIRTVAPRGSKA